jgi:predicted glutamine amidotransferase
MLAWDESSYRPERPFSYRSVNLPVFDQNLKQLAGKVRATTLLAHVRGVELRHNPTVGEQNLHPFRYQGCRLALAHNGHLAEFDRMRVALFRRIRPEIAQQIRGNCDTEWIYALFLSQLSDYRAVGEPDELVRALEKTLSIIRDVRREHDIAISSPANLFVTDGTNVIATRFTFDYGCYDMRQPAEIESSRHLYLSVWYTTGRSYGLHDGEWKMIGTPAQNEDSVLISSEPLTRDTSTWFEVPEYSVIVAAGEGDRQHVRVQSLNV